MRYTIDVRGIHIAISINFQKFRRPVCKNLFRGVINDLKHRFPHYLSDFTDGLNGQCIAATIFIYFAALSGAVAFGGLMGIIKICFRREGRCKIHYLLT